MIVKMHPLVEQHRSEIRTIAERHGLRHVRVFGSMARGDATDASDIDLLVSLPPDRTGLALGGLLVDAQDLLKRLTAGWTWSPSAGCIPRCASACWRKHSCCEPG